LTASSFAAQAGFVPALTTGLDLFFTIRARRIGTTVYDLHGYEPKRGAAIVRGQGILSRMGGLYDRIEIDHGPSGVIVFSLGDE
jgi:hypothetical protein